MSIRVLCTSRRAVERNMVRFYSRKRRQQQPVLRREYGAERTLAANQVLVHANVSPQHQFPKIDVPKTGFDHLSLDIALEARKQRLVQRLSTRSLEVDLLLSRWANRNIPNLTLCELEELEAFVSSMEVNQIYNILHLQREVPSQFQWTNGATGVVERLHAWVALAQASEAYYCKVIQR